MNDNYEDKKIPLAWAILASLVLWGFYGALFYALGKMARAALVG